MTHDELLAIRVYLFGDRFPDAVDVYSSATGMDRDTAAFHVSQIYEALRTEPGFWRKALLARLGKSLSLGSRIAFFWLIAALMWACALDLPIFRTVLWFFGVSLSLGMLVAQVVKWKPHAFALGSMAGGTAMVCTGVGLVVLIIRWLI